MLFNILLIPYVLHKGALTLFILYTIMFYNIFYILKKTVQLFDTDISVTDIRCDQIADNSKAAFLGTIIGLTLLQQIH